MAKRPKIKNDVQVESPERAVYLSGEIGDEAYVRLMPSINALRISSPAPISLFIDSFGGDTFWADRILRLLKMPRQDGRKCQLTSVCTGVAASSAADLLISGDYSIAYPGSWILIHGTRMAHKEITQERISEVDTTLREENEYFASRLANQMFRRLTTQALLMEAYKSGDPVVRVSAVGANPNDILARIRSNISKENQDFVARTLDRMDRIRKLVEYVLSKRGEHPPPQGIEADAELFKIVVDFEINDLKGDGKQGPKVNEITSDASRLINNDFFRVKDYLSQGYLRQAEALCRERGQYFLSDSEMTSFRKIPLEDATHREEFLVKTATPRVYPMWFLVMALCRQLQEGEHSFTPEEAWWFGFIDEVPGSALPSIRKWREARNRINAASSPTEQEPPVSQ